MGIILICDNLCMIWIYPLKTQDASGKWRFSSRIPTKHVIILGVTVTGWGVDPIIWWGFYAHHIRFGSFDSKRGGMSESFEGGSEARDVQNAWQTAQGFLRTSSLGNLREWKKHIRAKSHRSTAMFCQMFFLPLLLNFKLWGFLIKVLYLGSVWRFCIRTDKKQDFRRGVVSVVSSISVLSKGAICQSAVELLSFVSSHFCSALQTSLKVTELLCLESL